MGFQRERIVNNFKYLKQCQGASLLDYFQNCPRAWNKSDNINYMGGYKLRLSPKYFLTNQIIKLGTIAFQMVMSYFTVQFFI